ncbi:amidase family protein [Streptomyces yaizuensis]|uniref:Amidase domain-containing protein n=1 Tax=Streptomyces yaizuensis TaxID=2989713 RepID=A0ABQ5P3A2_9ACTN|nr:amidase family protein [Streptomyces sp. YSPA8]GLF97029.1 hypothetical protein SYYSPA8_22050 [Streptomyces sp. YSPA8]
MIRTFATSGSTGAPVTWLRTDDQLTAEARLVRETVIGPVDRVVTFAPPAHLYGRLYGEVLPALCGIPVTHAWRDPLVPPDLPGGGRTLLVCLPSTWQLLERLPAVLDRAGEIVALHSAGPTTPAAHRVAARHTASGLRAVEILGSTETGAVGHRAVRGGGDARPPYLLLPDVRRAPWSEAVEGPLRVGGPRLARRRGEAAAPVLWEMPDLVRWTGERSFHHLGRGSRLIKVDGVRCDLDMIERRVRAAAPALDPVCVAVGDPLRGEHYDLYYAGAADRPGNAAAVTSPGEVRAVLSGVLDGLPAPRAVHRVPVVPRGPSGKVRTADLTGGPRHSTHRPIPYHRTKEENVPDPRDRTTATHTTGPARAADPPGDGSPTGYPLAEKVDDYARHAGWTADGPDPAPGPALALPLAERVAARRSGALPAKEWRAQERAWSDASDARHRACVERRPLGPRAAPVRIGVKDTIDVSGFSTRLGLRDHRHLPRTSASALAPLPPALAEVTAKTVTTELNIGVGTGCVNPYAPSIDPAGSSTGAAVAVAAGIVDLSLGTDVLGSVRWPAGQCGTVGLRMTHDTELLSGVFPLCPPMDALGWVARTAADLALLWPLLGLDRLGRQSPAATGPLRIGLVAEVLDPASGCTPVMRATLDRAMTALVAAGHGATETRLGELWRMRGPAWELCARQAWDGHAHWRKWVDAELSATTRASLEVGAGVGDDRYGWILERLDACRAGVGAVFDRDGADVWLLPLDPAAPPDVVQARARPSTIPSPGDEAYDLRIGYTPIASFAGLPAITLPVARDERGAPLAVQIVGRAGAERTLIRLAVELSDAVGDLGLRIPSPGHP